MEAIIARLGQHRVVPVLTLHDDAVVTPLARALLAGGIDVMEITYRTPAATRAIARLRREFPELLVLAGTILDVEQLTAAIAAGAQVIISPTLNPVIINAARVARVAVIPGAATPTEVEQARRLGISLLKIFPVAQLGGTAYLRALHALFSDLRFLPTGGLGTGELGEYAQLDFVTACGLGSIATPELIDCGRFDEITARASQARMMMRFAVTQ